ncbi:hypothetical protein ABII15_16820 [Streptomyces sp. HUAS MG91]|uniref:Secreted protein n=1 Tax=Streptomyces tabacisoli TaxID=3156398 RepID=A0AAU8ITL2_9ACTN
MNKRSPRSATVLYTVAATCAVVGVLLRLRGRAGSAPVLSGAIGSPYSGDGPSAWRVWSSDVPEARLGVYLLVLAVVLAVVARLVSVWRD